MLLFFIDKFNYFNSIENHIGKLNNKFSCLMKIMNLKVY